MSGTRRWITARKLSSSTMLLCADQFVLKATLPSARAEEGLWCSWRGPAAICPGRWRRCGIRENAAGAVATPAGQLGLRCAERRLSARLNISSEPSILLEDGRVTLPTDSVQVVADPPDKGRARRRAPDLLDAVRDAVDAARGEALPHLAAFVLGRRALRSLSTLACCGVRVTVLTNSTRPRAAVDELVAAMLSRSTDGGERPRRRNGNYPELRPRRAAGKNRQKSE